jgi:uncharacterized protein (TIGR03437 family)
LGPLKTNSNYYWRLSEMRLLPAVLLASLASCSVFGQTYTIKTFAGGGLPSNLAATSITLGRMDGVAVDSSGNIFITLRDYDTVVRVDGTTRVLTIVAGIGAPGSGWFVASPGGASYGGSPSFSGDDGPATSAHLSDPSSVAVDSAGNLYIADTFNQRIRKVSGGVITTFAGGGSSMGDNGPPTSAQLSNPTGLAVDSRGSLYIAEGNRVRRVSNGVITTAAGNGTAGNSGDGGPATSAQLNHPSGIAVDSAGNLYIADTGNNAVRQVSNGVITTVAGNGTGGYSGDNAPATGSQLSGPYGVAVDPTGNLYITDTGNNRVRKVTGGVITTFAGGGPLQSTATQSPSCAAYPSGFVPFASLFSLSTPNSDGDQLLVGNPANYAAIKNLPLPAVPNQQFCGPVTLASGYTGQAYVPTSDERTGYYLGGFGEVIDPLANLPFPGSIIPTSRLSGVLAWRIRVGPSDNGPPTSAQLNQPHGIAINSNGSLYVADYGNARIRQVSNGVITTAAGNGASCLAGGEGGSPTGVLLLAPSAVTVDPAGSVYISEDGSQRIREVSNGVISTVAGGGHWDGDNVSATSAALNYPYGTAVDSTGNLYIADSLHNSVRKVSGGVITTVAGSGTPGFSGDGGPATSAQLNTPSSVAVDSAGNLYIADYKNDRVRKVTGGVITTVAFTGTPGFSGDNGPATSAQLSAPVSVAVDSAGNLYIADAHLNTSSGPIYSDRILKVSNGVITTVAGGGSSLADGGPATSALFTPIGIAVDLAGNLYINDDSGRIRKVSNGVITTIAGNGTYGFSGDNGPATSAQLSVSSGRGGGLAVDSSGNVYVADSYNQRIRVLIPSGPTCSASVSPTTFSPPVSGGNLTITIQTTASCPWAIQSLPQWITYSGNAVGAGPAIVTLAVASNTGTARSVFISVAGTSIPVSQLGAIPSLSLTAVTNAASNLGGPIAPGEIVTLYGTGLGPVQLTSAHVGSDGLYDAQLAGTSVQFNGISAPMVYTSATQVAAIVPYEVIGSSAQVTVTYQGQTSSAVTVAVAPSAPGIFTLDSTGKGQAAVVNQNYSINGASTPAPIGSIISLYATGEGQTSPPGVDGKPDSTPLPTPNLPVNVTIGGVTVNNLSYVGGAPGEVAGLMQINVQIPPGVTPGNAVPVVVRVGSASSQAGVTIAVSAN